MWDFLFALWAINSINGMQRNQRVLQQHIHRQDCARHRRALHQAERREAAARRRAAKQAVYQQVGEIHARLDALRGRQQRLDSAWQQVKQFERAAKQCSNGHRRGEMLAEARRRRGELIAEQAELKRIRTMLHGQREQQLSARRRHV